MGLQSRGEYRADYYYFFILTHHRAKKDQIDGKIHQQSPYKNIFQFFLEPGSTYFTHVAPKSGSSKQARKELLNELTSYLSIGCDRTAVNTEVKKQMVQILETSLQRPCSWLVCQLPTNKLLLRYVFLHDDAAERIFC